MAITTICYGERQVWKNAKEAKRFFMDCVMNSEGSEQSRYVNILIGIEEGYKHITDSGEYK